MNIDSHTGLPFGVAHSFGSALANAARSAGVAFLVNATTGVGGSAAEVQITFRSGAISFICRQLLVVDERRVGRAPPRRP